MNTARTGSLLTSALSSLLALTACVPARLAHEVATFQRALDGELAAALEPRDGPGLEAACHPDPIVWMHLVPVGDRWRLTSVDGRGQVGVWTERGLEQTWSLREDELEWVRRVSERQRRSEDADWLRARATAVPAGCTSLCSPGDIAPRDDHRWVGVSRWDQFDTFPLDRERRISASGDWFAVGDARGSLVVAPIAAPRGAAMWGAPACEDLHWASFDVTERPGDPDAPLLLVTPGRYRDHTRHIDLRRGRHALRRGELVTGYEIARRTDHDAPLVLGHDWVVPLGPRPRAAELLAELLVDDPGLVWRPIHMTLSTDTRWLAAAAGTKWAIRDRINDLTRHVDTRGSTHAIFATVSSRGTLAIARREGRLGFVDLHPAGGEPATHPLPAAPIGLAFVSDRAGAEDTLWIGIAGAFRAFQPVGARLLRLEPGGVPGAHPVAGFDEVDRVVGRLPVATPTLVVAGGGALGIERLTDGAVLRVLVHDRRRPNDETMRAPPTPDGLSLIWLDRDGRPRCRHDGAADDHAPSRVQRITDAGVLVAAFLAGRDCPQ